MSPTLITSWTLLATLTLAEATPADPGRAAVVETVERAANTVLVLKLRPVGVGEEVAATITDRIAEILFARSNVNVITEEDVNELVEHQRSASRLGCLDEACVAELSKVANAQRALSGTVGEVGGEIVITLTLVDVVETRSVGSGNLTVAGLDQVGDRLPGLVARVFGWEEGELHERATFHLPEGTELSFAVLDLRASGLDEATVQNLTEILAGEIKRVEGTSVVSRADIASMLQLEAQRDALDCADETSCLAEIGGALGVDKMVVGQVGKLAASFVVSLRLIDARSVHVDSRITESFKGEEDQLIRAVRHAGRRLLGIQIATPGVLAVAANQQPADVFLDNEHIGQLPLPPREGLVPGRHSLRVAKEGFFDWRSDFYVEPGDTTALWAAMTEEPTPWYRTWWVWGIAGAVVVGGTVAAILYANRSDTLGGTADLP